LIEWPQTRETNKHAHSIFFADIVSGSVHTAPEEFENAALFLRLGLSSTLKRSFRKRSSNRRNLTTPALPLSVDGNHFENKAYFAQTQIQTVIVAFSDFSGVEWTENI